LKENTDKPVKAGPVQVAKAALFYKRMFGVLPHGMWPGEGSVAHDIIPVFARQGIRWIATDDPAIRS